MLPGWVRLRIAIGVSFPPRFRREKDQWCLGLMTGRKPKWDLAGSGSEESSVSGELVGQLDKL